MLLSARLIGEQGCTARAGILQRAPAQLRVLAPSEPSGHSRVFIWELISLPRLPGGTDTLGICPRVLYFQLDVWFMAVPGNL